MSSCGTREARMERARTVASALLLFTGVAHLVKWLADSGADGAGMAVFGVIYFALGLLLRRPDAWPLWLAAVLPALGGLGGSTLLAERLDPVLALFVAMDVVVVACCVWLLVARRRA
jgi:hypothetical protein